MGFFANSLKKNPDIDCILVFDSCYSGTAAKDNETSDYSAEVVASVDSNQKAFENWSDFACVQNKTFTSHLADEIAK